MNPTANSIPVSVILCAHNPRASYLQATLEGLRVQDLPFAEWELILIDNQSSEPLSSRFDVSWHPKGRIVVEGTLGLAHARRRGYLESRGQLVIHSDDDNVLSPNYLRSALDIYRKFPQLGCFGGQIIARFEREPVNALERTFGFSREFDSDRWSNLLDDIRTMPYGAGMCLRREVIEAYLKQVADDPRRMVLGRTGARFITGEDIDLNFVAVRLGYGTGLCANMSLIHLIASDRMSAAHAIRYGAGNAYSMVLLHYLHTNNINLPRRSLFGNAVYWLRVYLRMSSYDRRMELAVHRARQEAIRDMKAWGWIP